MPARPGLQQRQVRNSERVLAAATAIAASEGWAGLTLTATAVRAELSRRAVHARYPNRSALGVAVWNDRAGPAVVAALARLLAAAGLLDGSDTGPSPDALADALAVLSHPDPVLSAAAELLVVSCYDPLVRAAVGEILGPQLAAWCDGRGSGPAVAARRGYLLVVGLGALLEGRGSFTGEIDWPAIAGGLTTALRAGAQPAGLPDEAGPDISLETVFDTGDVMLDRLLLAAVQLVGRQGFEQTSTAQIAGESGYSEGLLYSRYESKIELFLDATRRMAAVRVKANDDYGHRLAERHGPGIADAVTMREWQRPGLEVQRALNLEQIRLKWHDPAQAGAQRAESLALLDTYIARYGPDGFSMFNLAMVLGVGTVVLAVLHPGCWTLPYSVMTVPLADLGLL